MNREMKRMMQRQGQLSEDGSPAVQTRERRPPRPVTTAKERAAPLQFLRDVRGELRKVAWPDRAEVTSLSFVVLATLVLLISLIFVLDLGFAKAVLYLFKT